MSSRRTRRSKKAGDQSTRGKQLAMIHIAAAELGLLVAGDDSAYRDMLWSIARVRSARYLDEAGREAVLKHLRACGWQQKAAGSPRYSKGTPAALIRHLWSELHRVGAARDASDRALRCYIATHAKAAFGVDEVAPQHLDNSTATRIIEQLKRWLARVESEQANV